MNRLRTALALALAGPLLALGACSEDPQPRMAPSKSTSPTESPSGSVTSASQPGEGTQAVVVRRFFGQISTAISTGDSSAFLADSTNNCRNCHVIANNLAKAYANGGRIEEGHWTVLGVHRAARAANGGVWNVEVKTAKERWLDADDQLVKVVTPARLKFKVVVIGAPDEWKIRELRII